MLFKIFVLITRNKYIIRYYFFPYELHKYEYYESMIKELKILVCTWPKFEVNVFIK